MVKRITPILFVEAIEPCLPFWVDRLGFEKTAEVPDGDRLEFVMLQKGGFEVMYQTYASVGKDVPAYGADAMRSKAFLYVEVDDFDALLPKLKGVPVVEPERKTFYGMREIGVREPGGHFVTFAALVAAAAH